MNSSIKKWYERHFELNTTEISILKEKDSKALWCPTRNKKIWTLSQTLTKQYNFLDSRGLTSTMEQNYLPYLPHQIVLNNKQYDYWKAFPEVVFFFPPKKQKQKQKTLGQVFSSP